jgi:glutamate-5-semialdehyde dehydrogenase
MKDQLDAKSLIDTLGAAARAAAVELAFAPAEIRAQALTHAADVLWARRAEVIAANGEDLAYGANKGLSPAMMDRLMLDEARVEGIVRGLRAVAAQPDPVGQVISEWDRPTGLHIQRVRTPLGVIGVIYESRPNVTADAGALCLKSGNAVILRGGSESFHSSQAIHACLAEGLRAAGLPEAAIQLVPTRDRAAVSEMLQAVAHIDVIIPRGGKGLIERISAEAKVPVIKHLDGNCHTYVDDPCDIAMAVTVADNAKTQKYSPCNASEGLLVARGVAADFLPRIGAVYAAKGVEMRCDAEALALLAAVPGAKLVPATEQDWGEEYLAPIISVKVVAGVDEAIAHINRYGSHHTDAILTTNHQHAQQFLRDVDSASVMVNASTRFADGFEYGLGAEIGISTDKFHARGPVGIEGLTSLKYVVLGEGEIRT